MNRRGFIGGLVAASMLAMVRYVPVPQLPPRGRVVIENQTFTTTLVVPRGAIVRNCTFFMYEDVPAIEFEGGDVMHDGIVRECYFDYRRTARGGTVPLVVLKT